MSAVIESSEPIHSVHIDGLAVLKIVKHCQESLPNLVTGSLLGLAVENGVLEITHAFPFPEPRSNEKSDLVKAAGDSAMGMDDDAAALDGHEYQLEMMKMLREVNVDNNCVGWYQSMYLGSYSTTSLLQNQLSYQTDLSPNAVALLYDPMQTAHGNLVLKCVRLTPATVKLLREKKNLYLKSDEIFEEVPVVLKNPSLVQALLHSVKTGQYLGVNAEENNNSSGPLSSAAAAEVAPVYGADTTLDRLDLSTNPYLEKHLEFLSTWVDDLAAEQGKFQYYMRTLARGNDKRNRRGADKGGNEEKDPSKPSAAEAWASSEAPKRLESLLISNQIRTYCDQVDKFTDGGFGKLFIAEGLQKKA
uniref:Eukaryotic translation initiation factor 3 subunit H n=1 Tax=Chaetoceros debilis TaxID=122233 RepID=A0A7S3PVY4_9STRA|mmetsp:Transcript_30151/g.46128  ORF Transcript_30151/g.46128 Transcript_30151/m.46128 type:complete len:360 (-) Transcript_30151:146-1225(-)